MADIEGTRGGKYGGAETKRAAKRKRKIGHLISKKGSTSELKGTQVLDSERPKPSTKELKKIFSKKARESRKQEIDTDYLYGDWMKNKKMDFSKPVPSRKGKKIEGTHPIGDRKKKIKRKHPIGDRSKKISGQLM